MIAFTPIRNALITLLIAFVLWEVFARGLAIPEFLLPPPSHVLREIGVQADLLYKHALVTLLEIVLGFLLAVALGVGTGSVIVLSRTLEEFLYPLIVALQVVPKIAIAPLLLIWFGYGLLSKLVIVFLIAYFPIMVNTISGLKTVEPELIDLVRTLRANRWKIFRKVRFPNAIPFIFTGLRVAITTAVIGAIVAEFVGGSSGLGYLIVISNINLNTKLLFASLILLSVIGVGLFGLIVLVERLLIPWNVPDVEEAVRSL